MLAKIVRSKRHRGKIASPSYDGTGSVGAKSDATPKISNVGNKMATSKEEISGTLDTLAMFRIVCRDALSEYSDPIRLEMEAVFEELSPESRRYIMTDCDPHRPLHAKLCIRIAHYEKGVRVSRPFVDYFYGPKPKYKRVEKKNSPAVSMDSTTNCASEGDQIRASNAMKATTLSADTVSDNEAPNTVAETTTNLSDVRPDGEDGFMDATSVRPLPLAESVRSFLRDENCSESSAKVGQSFGADTSEETECDNLESCETSSEAAPDAVSEVEDTREEVGCDDQENWDESSMTTLDGGSWQDREDFEEHDREEVERMEALRDKWRRKKAKLEEEARRCEHEGPRRERRMLWKVFRRRRVDGLCDPRPSDIPADSPKTTTT